MNDKQDGLNIVSEYEVFEGDYIRVMQAITHTPVFCNGEPIAGRVESKDKYSIKIMLADESIFNLPLPLRLDYEIDLAFQKERKRDFDRDKLLNVFSKAVENDAKFLCVVVHIDGTVGVEYRINTKDNLKDSIESYKEECDENLCLKSSDKKIQIVGAVYGDSLSEIEDRVKIIGGKRYE